MHEHLWLFAYDISDRRRWRRAHRLLLAHGEPLQLSVFSVRATPSRADQVLDGLAAMVDPKHDRVVRVDLGSVATGDQRVRVVGSRSPNLERLPLFL